MLEILAPCGGADTIDAALKNGADAVYLGLGEFSARRNAKNFTFDELLAAVQRCHLRGMRVYVALNTLVFDEELDSLQAALAQCVACGVDAVILQDLALLHLIREKYPLLPIHASTQMTVTSVSGARKLRSMGFKRVVLARELSLSEIADICSNVDIEVEVFVHGALCVSLSGQCYMSAMLGGRSGNRGLCAQPCRLNYQHDGRENILSLKDLSLIQSLQRLQDAGVSSIKIEGRMKRPEYVAYAVNACYTARNGGMPDMELLRSVFSREGFTDGYFTGGITEMRGVRTKEDVIAFGDAEQAVRDLPSYEKKYTVDMRAVIKSGQATECHFTTGDYAASAVGAIPEVAERQALTAESVAAQLSKLGGTVFRAGQIDIEIDEGLFLSVSALNKLRRELVEQLEQLIIAANTPTFDKFYKE